MAHNIHCYMHYQLRVGSKRRIKKTECKVFGKHKLFHTINLGHTNIVKNKATRFQLFTAPGDEDASSSILRRLPNGTQENNGLFNLSFLRPPDVAVVLGLLSKESLKGVENDFRAPFFIFLWSRAESGVVLE